MIVPFLLFIASFLGCAAAVLLPGANDLVMLAGPMAVASLWLLLWAWAGLRPSSPFKDVTSSIPDQPRGPKRPRPKLFSRSKPKWVVVDGSNVMHWKDGTPQIAPIKEVIAKLTSAGYSPGVVFDANAGYKLQGRYKHDFAFGQMLGLPEDRVMVVPKGTSADPMILAAARDLDARIVSNDRFRDWTDRHPEVTKAGHVITGGYRDGQVWLDLGEGAVPKPIHR